MYIYVPCSYTYDARIMIITHQPFLVRDISETSLEDVPCSEGAIKSLWVDRVYNMTPEDLEFLFDLYQKFARWYQLRSKEARNIMWINRNLIGRLGGSGDWRSQRYGDKGMSFHDLKIDRFINYADENTLIGVRRGELGVIGNIWRWSKFSPPEPCKYKTRRVTSDSSDHFR